MQTSLKRSLYIIIAIWAVVLGTTHKATSQDAHFSQFYSSPIYLNPALTGTAAGTYRVSINYRDQWRGALDNPLSTLAFSGDLNFELSEGKYPDFAGLGFMFYSDRVSQFDLNTSQVALTGSYHKSLDARAKKYIGAGLQVGIGQKSINYEDLNFQDQFNAISGFTLPSGEILPQNALAYGDFAIGINYHSVNSKKNRLDLGVSYAHINSPNVSFYKNEDDSNPNLIRENALFSKLTVHASASFRQGQRLDVQPRLLAILQGPHAELNVGNNFKFMLNDNGTRYFHIGPWFRGVKNEEGFGVESLVLATAVEIEGIIIGLSYDHNLGDLLSDRQGLNALEISITFIGEHENNDNFCPTF